MTRPIEPPPTRWEFPPPERFDAGEVVAVGGDLEPGTLLLAYRSGLFPMGRRSGELMWWSPDPRGVLPLEGLRVSTSLRKSMRKLSTTVDAAFEDVMTGCADRPPDQGPWITSEIREAYVALHELGWAHSVETWTPDDQLVGGLYGVAIGGLFAGESMFSRVSDASKVALVALVGLLGDGDPVPSRLLDVQWLTPHLASLGAVEIPRTEYLSRLDRASRLPLPRAFDDPGRP